MNLQRLRTKHAIARLPVVGWLLLTLYRLRIAGGYVLGVFTEMVRWLFRSREITNFTYDLTTANKRYLAALLADVTGQPVATLMGYVQEIDQDDELKQHVRSATLRSDERHLADLDVFFGRRLGWYALVRAIKPKVVVETGVDKGLGACVLTAALLRNDAEGAPGTYYGLDINPAAGYLLSGRYATMGRILYGDSIATLQGFDQQIDFFVNDSDHSAQYEAREYSVIQERLAPNALILGDNAHCTEKLLDFALASDRQFVFFKEEPIRHWYPGAGIGIAFRRDLMP